MTGYNAMMHGYDVGLNDFTLRQQRIMIGLARGASIQTICAETGLAPMSVRAMVSDICLFLGAADPAGTRRWVLDQFERTAVAD